MKTIAKVLHFLWAGGWSAFLLWVSLSDFSWTWFRVEPHMIAIPIASLAWMPFAVGLFFERGWAWYGSFVLTVLSLFVAFYVTWMSAAIARHEGGSFHWEIVGSMIALAVLAALLQTRQDFLKPHERIAEPNAGAQTAN
jgi:hypothetical protein